MSEATQQSKDSVEATDRLTTGEVNIGKFITPPSSQTVKDQTSDIGTTNALIQKKSHFKTF